MGFLLKAMLGALLALGLSFPALADDRAIIILDGSGSMWAQVDGKARITIARETLASVLAEVPPDLELGFMSYGHREKGNCNDIEMLVPPAAGTAPAIIAAADKINPKGKTPLSEAVRRAAEALQYTEEKATVILITDGLETCDVDPCALATDLKSKGVDFTAHVLGFGLSDEEGRQVACLAENTGGKYLSAQDGKGLVDALTQTVKQVTAAPEPTPTPKSEPAPKLEFNFKPSVSLAEGGPDFGDGVVDIAWQWFKRNADGSKGDPAGSGYYATLKDTLEPGDYILEAEIGETLGSVPFTVKAGELAAPHVVMNGALVDLSPLPAEGAEPDSNAVISIKQDGKDLATLYGHQRTVVPAKPFEAEIAIGPATVTRSYEPKPGDTIKEDVVVGVGIAHATAEYVPGSPVKDNDIAMNVFEAKKALDGSRKQVTYGYGGEEDFTLAAGDYVLAYELDGVKGEVPFTVKTGERVDVPVVLDAGVLAVTTPGDDYVEFRGAKKDIAGNVEQFGYGYGPAVQTTLKAGDYIVHVEKDGASSDTPVAITAGERQELTVSAAEKGGKKK